MDFFASERFVSAQRNGGEIQGLALSDVLLDIRWVVKVSGEGKGKHFGRKPGRFKTSNHSLSHELGGEGVVRVNERASGPVLSSQFLAILPHGGKGGERGSGGRGKDKRR